MIYKKRKLKLKKKLTKQDPSQDYLSLLSGQRGLEKRIKNKIGSVLNLEKRENAIDKMYKRIHKKVHYDY